MKQIRYKNRKSVDELIQPILNLDIINLYFPGDPASEEYQKEQEKFLRDDEMFPALPTKFDSPIRYQELWIQLNLFETYNQLINQRNDSDKDAELARMYGMKMKNDNAKKSFKGYIAKEKQNRDYFYLRLREKEQPIQA